MLCTLYRDAVAPMYCDVCHIHLCKDCVEKHFSHKSNVHNVVPLEQFFSTDFEGKKEILRNDLQELEKSIFPKYQESDDIIKTQKTDQRKHSQKLTSDLNKQ